MDWKKKDKRYVWHPFTQMEEYCAGDPVVIESGHGVKLVDTEGREYFDGVSSLWLNVHGHSVDPINRAIERQLEKIQHSTLLGRGSVPSIRLAERLVEVSPPGLEKVFYSDSGATAVEIGMKMAIQYWANESGEATSRRRFLTFRGGYHGDTLGPMSVVPDPTFHWPFMKMFPDPVQVDFPGVGKGVSSEQADRARKACMRAVEEKLKNHQDELAGILVEPVQGAGGMVTPPEGFLRGLRELADRYDRFLLVDEVATGFGKLGTMFACDREGITPDIMPLGKGLTGGYLPVAATLATERIYERFLGDRREALLHGHSYTGNALGCAAALTSLDMLEEMLPELPDRIEWISEQIREAGDCSIVGEIRQAGFMCGIVLMREPERGVGFEPEERAGWRVCEQARERGMLIRPLGDVVVFMPPLASTRDQLGEMLDILVESLRATAAELT